LCVHGSRVWGVGGQSQKIDFIVKLIVYAYLVRLTHVLQPPKFEYYPFKILLVSLTYK